MKVRKYYDPEAVGGGGTEDVNTDVNPPEDSSPQETGNVEESDPSAGTLNTEETPQTVPYDRFKEINEKYKSLSEKEELYGVYAELDKHLASNPEALKKLQGAFEVPQANPIEAVNREVMALKAENRINGYKSQFNELVSKEPTEHKEFYDEFVEAELFKLTKFNPVQNYDPKALSTAFNNVKQRLSKLTKAATAQYVKGKNTDTVPTNRGGSAPKEGQPKLRNAEDRAAYAKEYLKASRNS